MGFIQSNHSVIMYNNTMISFNMMEVSRIEGIKRCAVPTTLATPKILPLFTRQRVVAHLEWQLLERRHSSAYCQLGWL